MFLTSYPYWFLWFASLLIGLVLIILGAAIKKNRIPLLTTGIVLLLLPFIIPKICPKIFITKGFTFKGCN